MARSLTNSRGYRQIEPYSEHAATGAGLGPTYEQLDPAGPCSPPAKPSVQQEKLQETNGSLVSWFSMNTIRDTPALRLGDATALKTKAFADGLSWLLLEGGFDLRQWACNIPAAVEHLPSEAISKYTEIWLSKGLVWIHFCFIENRAQVFQQTTDACDL